MLVERDRQFDEKIGKLAGERGSPFLGSPAALSLLIHDDTLGLAVSPRVTTESRAGGLWRFPAPVAHGR